MDHKKNCELKTVDTYGLCTCDFDKRAERRARYRRTFKLLHTLRICRDIFMARTFGKYLGSGWDGLREYCRYSRNGKVFFIPTGADTNDE